MRARKRLNETKKKRWQAKAVRAREGVNETVNETEETEQIVV